MSFKDTAFFRGNRSIHVGFNARETSSDGGMVLLEKLERKHKTLSYFSRYIPDPRDPNRVVHGTYKLLKQRVFCLCQGYEDGNDASYLKNDPLFADTLEGQMASQPTVSRFENRFDKKAIWDLCNAWLDRYVSSLQGRKEITIDVDATDDPAHGGQQLSMFNGYYGQFMYNELFFHDGDTGQIILPVLRPGNSHSNKWFVGLLRRILDKVQKAYPGLRVIVRADSGFSCPGLYKLADDYGIGFVVGLANNSVLKKKVERTSKAVKRLYVDNKAKHQHFFKHTYQAQSWHMQQTCYTKVESTGKGLNVRHIVSNLGQADARQIYFGCYVKRGEASENRIKEIKNMCFSDRLSNQGFWANFGRLLTCSMAYELFLLVKKAIGHTRSEQAKRWCIDTIRKQLLKIGATIKVTKRRVYYQLSKAFVNQGLFNQLIFEP